MIESMRAGFLTLMLLTLLAGCGGGGGNKNTNDDDGNPPPPPAPSSDASLSSLTTSQGNPAPVFAPDQLAYSLSVTAAVDAISVTPTTSDPGASVMINGAAVISGNASADLPLAVGDNNIAIDVTAEDGAATRSYDLAVRRLNDVATLSSLSLSSGEFDQAFQSANFNYSASVGFAVNQVEVTAALTDSNASMVIDGTAAVSGASYGPILLSEGANTIVVDVTSEDGTATASYSIDVTRQFAGDFAQTAYIKGSHNQSRDYFGTSVAIEGDTLVVGAYGEDGSSRGVNNGDLADNGASQSGAVFVFTRDAAGTWTEKAYIKSSNSDAGDEFGRAIALDGDTLAVGTYREQSASTGINSDQTDNSLLNAGAVYVFTRDATGNWSQQAYIKASNTSDQDWFGGTFKLGLSGDTLAVPAINEDTIATDSGAVYVYVRDGNGNWSEQAMLKASNAAAGDQFGISLAIEGDTIVVGSQSMEGHRGAAYVFSRDANGNWSETQILTATHRDPEDFFGVDVAISGGSIAVGAQGEASASRLINGDETDNSAPFAGAVYVFERDSGGAWTQDAYIKASNADAGDYFTTVALSGDLLVVGARIEDSSASGVNGNQDNNTLSGSGAGYVFVRDQNGTWSQRSYIKASNPDSNDQFFGPATDGNTLVFRAIGEDSAAMGINGIQTDNSALWAGAVYVFE